MSNVFKKIQLILNPEPHIYIIRHGHTNLNESSGTSVDKIRGWIDVPLNDEGRQDADKARKTLLKEGVKPNKIYVSNLSRTIETAAIINKSFNAPTEETINLRPWDMGDFAGQETKKVLPHMLMYMDNPELVVPNGESFNKFKIRYISFLQKVIGECQSKKTTILLVTHFRNVKLAQAWITAGMKPDYSIDVDVMNIKDVEPGEVRELPLKLDNTLKK